MKEFLMNLTTKQKTILGIIAAIIMIIIFIFAYKYFYIDTNKEESTEIEQSTNEAINNDTNEIGYEDNENLDDGILNSKKKKSAIIVHIIGEVNKPGVVKLEEGARIIDAISAAGGQTENADLSKVNLAYIVEDPAFDDLELLQKHHFLFSIKYEAANKDFLQKVIDSGLEVDIWIINDKKTAKALLKWPITSMTSDLVVFDH